MLKLIGFDGDDTLWRSQEFYDDALARFCDILDNYLDMDDAQMQARMLEIEQRNLALFGYGAKGMTLSMIETAVAVTEGRIKARDIHQIVGLGKELLQHPVELLPGMREAVLGVAERHAVILITKGDLFHQEKKVAQSGLAELFERIEIVSEKDPDTYRRVLRAYDIEPAQFAMLGNSLRSDIEPVVRLGGWGVHMPYHTTWAHETEHDLGDADLQRVVSVTQASEIVAAVQTLAAQAAR